MFERGSPEGVPEEGAEREPFVLLKTREARVGQWFVREMRVGRVCPTIVMLRCLCR